MKKILTGLVLLFAILLAAIYLFIPGKLNMEANVTIDAALPGVSRSLSENNSWETWWPAEKTFVYDQLVFSIKSKSFNVFEIDIVTGNDTINSRMDLLPGKANSMTLEWNAEQPGSSNPFKRFSRYRRAQKVEKDMAEILTSLQSFMENAGNIYGFDVKMTTVTDSVLISTRRQFGHYPTTIDVNDMIQSLKNYIGQNNASEKNAPMLNIFEIDSTHYEAMTAIPVDRQLPQTKEFAPKFLLKGGNILEAEIRGGPNTIEKALDEIENYRTDYKFTSPAIPYQLLLTDRMKEKDTAKWITRIYYPVF
jgi:hypothetical protein